MLSQHTDLSGLSLDRRWPGLSRDRLCPELSLEIPCGPISQSLDPDRLKSGRSGVSPSLCCCPCRGCWDPSGDGAWDGVWLVGVGMGEIGVLGSMLLLCRRRSSGMLSCALAIIRAPAANYHASTSQVRRKAMPSSIHHINQHMEDDFANIR